MTYKERLNECRKLEAQLNQLNGEGYFFFGENDQYKAYMCRDGAISIDGYLSVSDLSKFLKWIESQDLL